MIFSPDLAKLVSDGRKTATRRRRNLDNPRSPWWWHRCRYTEGQRFAVQPGRGKHRICEAVITSVREERLCEMSGLDAYREGFADLAAFRERWEAINGSYDPGETVHVIEFRKVR